MSEERNLNEYTRRRVTVRDRGVVFVDCVGNAVVQRPPKRGSRTPRVACYMRPGDRKPFVTVPINCVMAGVA